MMRLPNREPLLFQRLLKRIHCTLAGHPMSVSHLESIEGRLYALFETCSCGAKGRPDTVGLRQASIDARRQMERLSGVTDYLRGEDTH
jgi:hypothetical protein